MTNEIVLGIDPGTAIIGYGFVTGTKQNPNILDFGVIRVASKDRSEGLILREIIEDLESLIKKHNPKRAYIEKLFFNSNQKTVISVAQARGAILYLLAKYNIQTLSPTPLQVKQTVCGHGNAGKKEVQVMVKKLFKLEEIPKPDDAADSLAIAWWGL
jgi:crossover junction endodeoxyribonuclease RuvC